MSGMRLGPVVAPLALLAACALEDPAPYDAGRFDVREVTVAPRPDATLDDLAGAADATLVDVTVADLPPLRDVPARDGAAPDVPASCVSLANEHASAVRAAQDCLRDEDCDALLCETLCCACEVFVSGRSPQVATARMLQARADAEGCTAMLPCARTPCGPASRAVCSSEGRCVTLREGPGDAGADR